jgi:hypothetical protein
MAGFQVSTYGRFWVSTEDRIAEPAPDILDCFFGRLSLCHWIFSLLASGCFLSHRLKRAQLLRRETLVSPSHSVDRL